MLLQEHLAVATDEERTRKAADRRLRVTVTARKRKAHAVELERVRASVLLLPEPAADDRRGA